MSATSAATPHPGAGAPTAPVAHDFRLAMRTTEFEAGLAGLLHHALGGASRRESLDGLCGHLGRLLRLPLALLARKAESGTMALEASSAENGLWLELQRIPERWDGGLSSAGPAPAALRAASAIQMDVRSDGFALWCHAAESERARTVLAVPIIAGDASWVLEAYFDGEIARGASTATVTVGRLAQSIRTFMEDLDTIAQQRLLARALAGAGNAAFITDLEGTIVWSNPAFSALSGYAADEVRGRNPSVLRSGRQGTRYYRELWGTIRAGKVWSGETVDRGKDGHEYVIQQTVSPVAQDERITHYVSIHQDIGRERRAREQLELASHVNPDTGLLTPSAFQGAVESACAEARGPMALAVVSLRGLQRAAPALGEEMERLVTIALGKRVREAMPEPDLAGMSKPFEYALLLRGDVAAPRIEARLRTLSEKLGEPLPYLGELPQLDLHVGFATFPEQGATYQQLWLKADRQLANEPYARARRATH
jgi:PAS domain S-box-containing protein